MEDDLMLSASAVEYEDLHFSDSEELPQAGTKTPSPTLTIDYNSRLISKKIFSDSQTGDDCDTHFCESKNSFLHSKALDNHDDTSSEELDVSSEEQILFNNFPQKLNLSGMASVSNGIDNLNSLAAYNYSSTVIKEDCKTDDEYISEDERGENSSHFEETKICRKLSFGLSVAGMEGISSTKQETFPPLSCSGSLLSAALNKKGNSFSDLSDTPKMPLMTCLEFLQSEVSEDEGTDFDEVSRGSSNEAEEVAALNNIYDLAKIPGKNGQHVTDFNSVFTLDDLRYRGKLGSGLNDNRRKCSWTTELITDDDTLNAESESATAAMQKRKLSGNRFCDTDECTNEILTDEEFIDIDNKEWTETDDSGSIRQIMQIKTETSIKLEGDGDSSALDGEDLVSRATATTTTRIVTTVTTDQNDGSEQEQQTADDSEDLRHSVEVILNQFMSDDSSGIKPEDSSIEHDE